MRDDLPAPIEPKAPDLLSVISRAAADPAVDVDKMERLVALYERHQAAQARQAYNEAMNAAQAEIEPVTRDAENDQTHSFFAKLETIDKLIRPIYLRHGFSLSDDVVAPFVAGYVGVQCRVSHIGGHTEVFHREGPPDVLGIKGNPSKTVLHGIASTETYLRRYLRCGIFNVVFKSLDNDGNQQPRRGRAPAGFRPRGDEDDPAGADGVPVLTREQFDKVPPGTRYRTHLGGNVFVKQAPTEEDQPA